MSGQRGRGKRDPPGKAKAVTLAEQRMVWTQHREAAACRGSWLQNPTKKPGPICSNTLWRGWEPQLL